MPIPATSRERFWTVRAFGWYWYFLATPSLMLDRRAGSATLEVPFTESQESTPNVRRARGQNESS